MHQLVLARPVALVIVLLAMVGFTFSATGAVNVTQHHNHATRDGLYIDPAFTPAAAANLKRDLNFDGTVSGNVYAQPLYVEDGPGGRAMLIVVTESDNVYALDAATGTIIWQRNVAAPAPIGALACGDINPSGITGTPIVDLASRALFFDAMTTPDGGVSARHMIFSLNVDTGATNPGWPINVDATVNVGGRYLTSSTQNQRGALAIVGGYLYVPYGGLSGDCSTYYGWIVGVPLTNPASVLAWSTSAKGGGAWGVGGIASDGANPYLATGNTFGAGTTWGGGEAIIRFQPGPVFSALTTDYWVPTNWAGLDLLDLDIGGTGPLLLDVPGATPPKLVVAHGKNGYAYLLNRTNLGGISPPIDLAHLSSSHIVQAAATYQTAQGTHVVFAGNTSQLVSFRITATSPPTIATGWTVSENGKGSPFVTSTDGTNNVIVWGIGAESDQRLHGFDGDTGAVIFSGGGANELMAGTHRFSTAIAARGRIYAATDNKVFAFTVPVATFLMTNLAASPNGAFQFAFTNTPGMSYSVFGSTNVNLPFTNWTRLGLATEISSGHFQYADPPGGGNARRFYRVTSP